MIYLTKKVPKIIPENVAMSTTIETKTIVFFVPITLRITSILGRDKAGPASRSASAGPFPIPFPIKPCRIGTSVRVAKYIKAPLIEAKKFAQIEFPPTRVTIQRDGINPSCPGLPRNEPATKTPINNKGIWQSERLAGLLKDASIDKIFSSDLLRSYETAKIIFKNRSVEKTKKFREMNFGIFEGLGYEQIMKLYDIRL